MLSPQTAQSAVRIEALLGAAHPKRPRSRMPAANDARPLAAWADRCLRRLRELRPGDDPLVLSARVDEIAREVSGFDPDLAAEMEHECWD